MTKNPQSQNDVLLSWYKTVRDETLGSVSHRSQIVSYGLAAVGVLAGTGIAALSSSPGHSRATAFADVVSLGIFGVSIPLIALTVLLMWLGEFVRMIRAGRYLRMIERELAVDVVLGWETYLTRTPRITIPYLIIPALFSLIAIGSDPLGIVVAGGNISIRPPVDIANLGRTLVNIGVVSGITYATKRLWECRRDIEREIDETK